MDGYILYEHTSWNLFYANKDNKSYQDVLFEYIEKYNKEKEHIWEIPIYKFDKDDYIPFGNALSNSNGLYLLHRLDKKIIVEIEPVTDSFNKVIPKLFRIRQIGFILDKELLN